MALAGIDLANFFVALILLGIGWNFGFIGATAMLASAHDPQRSGGRMQGMNDFIVFGGVTFASLASGGLMNCSGGTAIEGWAAVNIAMAPFLVLAGGALILVDVASKDGCLSGLSRRKHETTVTAQRQPLARAFGRQKDIRHSRL